MLVLSNKKTEPTEKVVGKNPLYSLTDANGIMIVAHLSTPIDSFHQSELGLKLISNTRIRRMKIRTPEHLKSLMSSTSN